jgi:hypothetical protein
VDRTWYSQARDGTWIAGTVAGLERISIPLGQRPVAAGAGVVVTVEQQSVDVPYATRVRVVRIDGGTSPAPIDLPGSLGTGAFAKPRTVVVSGGGATNETGPGVYAIDVESGQVSALIEPGPPPGGRIIAVSPSGNTVLASDCAASACVGDVIQLPDGTVTGQIGIPGIPRQVSDDTLKFNSVDGDVAIGIGAVDLASGALLWRMAADIGPGYLTSRGTIVQDRGVTRQGVRRYEIVLIDLRSGGQSVIYSRPVDDQSVVLWPELSSDSVAVLGFGYFESDAGQESSVALTLLDLVTGRLSPNAFTLAIDENR